MSQPPEDRNTDTPAPSPKAALSRTDRTAMGLTIACGLGAVVAFTGNFLPDEWLNVPMAGLLVFLAMLYPAYRLRARAALETRRREVRPITIESVQSPDRPPVLYLRSFEDDERGARMKGSLTEEEHLAKVLSQIGPFLAIGRPGEGLPELGASRIYVNDSDWQSTVQDLLRNARLVIIRTGRTMGLGWEIEQAVRVLTPQQLVLLVDSAGELREVLERINNVHPGVRTRIRMGWRSIGKIRGFVMFDGQWRASALRVRGPGWYFFYTEEGDVKRTTKKVARTLRPLFQALGMRWQPPPLNGPLVFMSALTVALFLLAIVVDLLGY